MAEKLTGKLEKRRHSRVQKSLKVQYLPISDEEALKLLQDHSYREADLSDLSEQDQSESAQEGTTKDMSLGGISLMSDVPLKDLRYLLLEIGVPELDKIIRVLAMVIRTYAGDPANNIPENYGIQIVSIHKEDHKDLQGFLDSMK